MPSRATPSPRHPRGRKGSYPRHARRLPEQHPCSRDRTGSRPGRRRSPAPSRAHPSACPSAFRTYLVVWSRVEPCPATPKRGSSTRPILGNEPEPGTPIRTAKVLTKGTACLFSYNAPAPRRARSRRFIPSAPGPSRPRHYRQHLPRSSPRVRAFQSLGPGGVLPDSTEQPSQFRRSPVRW